MKSYNTSALNDNFHGKEIKEVKGGHGETWMDILLTDGSSLKVSLGTARCDKAWLIVEQIGKGLKAGTRK